jgi:hypothetical protein
MKSMTFSVLSPFLLLLSPSSERMDSARLPGGGIFSAPDLGGSWWFFSWPIFREKNRWLVAFNW